MGTQAGNPTTTPGDFLSPAAAHGPVPFWWWVGEPVTRERAAWQLDQLKAKGVLNAIISYNHHADGTPNTGEPAVFSPAWWDLLRGVLDDCKARGMQLSFQDYTLLNPLLREIGSSSPGMAGGGTLGEAHWCGEGPACVRLEGGGAPVGAWAYPVHGDCAEAGGALDLRGRISGDSLEWTAPAGRWLVSLVFVQQTPFDPMHAGSGRLVIERFYSAFEKEIGPHLGSTFPVSFQDELDFGSSMPRWSRGLPDEFRRRMGYDLEPALPALWHDLGPRSAKIRIDYADVVVSLMEEHYFIPVFEWHERHGLLFANDNLGRGGIDEGRRAYGDAFRTMRWYSAPGTDDPNVNGPRAFRGLKVNSSIAHLYGRPRVWNEGFHSSGWGTTPGEVIKALNEDFIYGANVVNLHGLYYSTFGSWWEWAPPDFHFRQPYWGHTEALSGYVTRLSQVLASGAHVCDVALLYPITALEGGLNPRVDPSPGLGWSKLDAAEEAAFGIGRELVAAGLDFDFVDFQSLERAEVRDGAIRIGGERYRALVLPWMSALRFSSLRVAAELAQCGGLVIAFGCLPSATEKAGTADPEVVAMVDGLFCREGARGVFIADGYHKVRETIVREIGRDFDPGHSGFMAVHRRDGGRDFYFVFNPGERAVEAVVGFRVSGDAAVWDVWTGRIAALEAEVVGGVSRIRMRLEAGEGRLVAFDQGAKVREPAGSGGLNRPHDGGGPLRPAVPAGGGLAVKELDGPWEFTLEPTMDNRFGDFRLPADDALLGPEARRFRFYRGDDLCGCERADFDDSGWPLVTASFGPRFWKLGPLPAGADLSGLEGLAMIDPQKPVLVGGRPFTWEPYEFSLRWGVENDPHLKDWASGPHGLKGAVPDEFIDLHSDQPGATWLLWTGLVVGKAVRLPFVMGSRSRYEAWINGQPVLKQDVELPPGRISQWNLPHYDSQPREREVALHAGVNPLLLRFTQSAGQRVRAYAAFDLKASAPVPPLTLRWFAQAGHPVFDCRPGPGGGPCWFRLQAPPALRAFTVVSRAPVRAWNNGLEISVGSRREGDDGLLVTRFVVADAPPRASIVALRTVPVAGFHGGDLLPEPVRFECGTGVADVGDWSGSGLATYSGTAWYRKNVLLSAEEASGARFLDLGRVAATAAVRINGRPAGTLLAPPWQVPVEGLLVPGENRIEIHAANTLANHFSVGIPSPYVFDGQTVSGLLGPVVFRG